MRSDATLAFVVLGGAGLSLVPVGGVNNIPSPGIIDLLGLGVNVPATNIIGNVTNFGANAGVGARKQEINVALSQTVANAPAGAGATLNIALQGAADAGLGVPGAWQTIDETGAITLAQLQTWASGAAQQPIRLDWPPNLPDNLNARFYRLLFQTPNATPFTAGVIASALVVPCRDDNANRFTPRNYAVS